MVQMIATEGYNNLAAAREDIRNSSVLKLFQPQHTQKEYEAVEKYKNDERIKGKQNVRSKKRYEEAKKDMPL